MIFIARGNVPAVLSATDADRLDELARAKAHYNKQVLPRKGFEFVHYKHDSVKVALRIMFGRFCAYCESDYACATPADIEHFRPKGAYLVQGKKKAKLHKPGYWWLGASWDNLLLSCPGCNRVWTQEIKRVAQAPTMDLAGKGNWFPLADESKRATKEGDEVHEQSVLVNPCIDKPKNHFRFLENGMIEPMDIRGDISIKVYGLARADLVSSRSDHAKRIRFAMSMLKMAVNELNFASPNPFEKIKLALDEIYAIRRERYKAVVHALFDTDFRQLMDGVESALLDYFKT
ncbi:hypothetical protein QN360_18475 [Glaciimonas sp. CA11.2]|uniref:hypothetical protein n=1 Tax=unclassified Glaciimonas TaxID=2644401 RepID=UPI002AB5D841|nr:MULTISPECIES: hypothetical protein [unclassified Glaciimonas]MDY7548767.1 hypothetical protein [Glaciimonas sp. CA11.2]MEB0012415.1 hypothetical protein [Glaciimonas sp. Cout2]MEB0082656.1 hypothetical protein [Glaciimonas sp. Gout2]MEB0164882.1 hypothetical protein [Glaciimonas sp. CA11.2]